MKKVCVIVPASFTRDSRARRTARTMARHAEVHVFHVPGGPDEAETGALREPGIRLFPLTRRPTRFSRVLLHSLFFLETADMADAVNATGERYDVIYAHDLPSTYPALRLARRHRARIIYDVHDLYLETINQFFPETARFPKPVLYALARGAMRASGSLWERHFMRSVDLLVTPTEGCLTYLRDRYGVDCGHLVPNFPRYQEVTRSERLYEACGIPSDKAIVLYHGSLGRGRFLDRIVRSARHFAEENVLAIVGNGHLERDLKSIAARPELRGKVYFLDHVPYDELLPLVSGAALGLVLIEPINLSKEYSLANKLTEYMAAGVAVLASDLAEHRRVLQETDAGYIIGLSTPEELAARINALLKDRAAVAEKGRRGRAAFRERFHWEAHEPRFERAFLDLIEAA